MVPSPPGASFAVTLHFSADLMFFLTRRARGAVLVRHLREKTSVKDVIESCGVPHTEVHRITSEGVLVSFEHQLASAVDLKVSGVLDFQSAAAPGLQTRRVSRFVADGHLGKLTRDLRLLGLDVVYAPSADDEKLADLSSAEERALLTRDRRLLMRKIIRDGYCVRSTAPDEQIVEVLRRYELQDRIAPYTRCIGCNEPLTAVAKAEVLEELEPLTRVYYEEFRRCSGCGKIYWSGSHFQKLQERVGMIRARLNRKPDFKTAR